MIQLWLKQIMAETDFKTRNKSLFVSANNVLLQQNVKTFEYPAFLANTFQGLPHFIINIFGTRLSYNAF